MTTEDNDEHLIDNAEAVLKEVIGAWLLEQNIEGTIPLVAACNLFSVLYDVMTDPVTGMGRMAVRAALLMVYEKSFEEPMSFIERDEAKSTLDQISNARRKVEGKASLILPGAQ